MKNVISTQNDVLSTPAERDRKRFDNLRKAETAISLFHTTANGQHILQFRENGFHENVSDVEVSFADSAGAIYTVTQNDSMFYGIQIFFKSDQRILIGYQLSEEEPVKYCSWGYKNSSATVEKLFVYFKTSDSTYLVHMDAMHPEHQFLFIDTHAGETFNHAQNLYQFLKNSASKGDEYIDCLS